MNPHHLALVLVLVLAVGAGCRSTPPTSPSPQEAPAVRFEMSEHYMDVWAIKDAIVDGEVDTVAELAERLADREREADHPASWRPHVRHVVDHAEALVDTAPLDVAAAVVAELGGACGGCHRDLAIEVAFDDTVEPEPDDTAAGLMRRHQWAVDRMWEGLVGPSDWAWTHGASLIAEAPGCAESPDAPGCAEIATLGPDASAATDATSRVEVYGKLLGTCAACHAGG